MRLFKQLLTNNKCYKVGDELKVQGVMWHSTGANNPNIKRYVQPDDGILGTNTYGNHWNQELAGGREACVHAFIGKVADGTIATYQTLPWSMRGWHAGGTGNDTHIGFEICEDDLTSVDYFNAVYKEACELTAYLCEMYNLDPMDDYTITCHCEGHSIGIASNHADVMHWFNRYGKTMDDVRRDVKAIMDGDTADDKVLYRVQCGAFSNINNAKNLKAKLEKDGYDTYLVSVDGLYKVQCGAFANKDNALRLEAKLKSDGYATYITTKSGKAVADTTPTVKPETPAQPSTKPVVDNSIKEGDLAKVKRGAKSYSGASINEKVYDNVYPVDQLNGDRAVLDVKGLCTAFNVKDLIKVTASAIKEGDTVRVKSGAKTYTGGGVSQHVYNNEYPVDQLDGDRAVLDVKGLCTAFNVNDLIKV